MADLLAYRAQMARLHALEARYTPKLRAALIRMAEPAVEAAQAGAPAIVAAAMVSPRYLLPVLEALYADCGTTEAAVTYDALTADRKALPVPAVLTAWGQRLRKFIRTEGAAAVRGITETTRAVVRQVLTEAADAGSSIPQTVRALRERVAALAPQRARTIARTELLTASNYGSQLGAAATGLKLRKRWLATPGARTRPSHAAAGGQTVQLADVFTVGGAMARYPGDPLLPPGERCNCRCSITYVPD